MKSDDEWLAVTVRLVNVQQRQRAFDASERNVNSSLLGIGLWASVGHHSGRHGGHLENNITLNLGAQTGRSAVLMASDGIAAIME